MSPTQRSLGYLRDAGYLAAVVEHWNSHAGIRQDLFGCIDLVAVRPCDAFGAPLLKPTVGVQTTSGSNMAARIDKLRTHAVKLVKDGPELAVVPMLLAAGWTIEVHGWRKIGRFWRVRIFDMQTNTEREG